jgi:hypothetical protein
MRAVALCSISEAGKYTDDIHDVTLRFCLNMWHPVMLLKITELLLLILILISNLDVVFSVVVENCY